MGSEPVHLQWGLSYYIHFHALVLLGAEGKRECKVLCSGFIF